MIRLENITKSFEPARLLPAHVVYENQSAVGPQSQLIHAAIDAGNRARCTRNDDRPGAETTPSRGSIVVKIGRRTTAIRSRPSATSPSACTPRRHRSTAQAQLDATIASPTTQTIGLAKIAVAEAKVQTTEVAPLAASKLFELAGTRSTLGEHNLDRFWRDPRTHTLHDPVLWKYHAVGQYHLNGSERRGIRGSEVKP